MFVFLTASKQVRVIVLKYAKYDNKPTIIFLSKINRFMFSTVSKQVRVTVLKHAKYKINLVMGYRLLGLVKKNGLWICFALLSWRHVACHVTNSVKNSNRVSIWIKLEQNKNFKC